MNWRFWPWQHRFRVAKAIRIPFMITYALTIFCSLAVLSVFFRLQPEIPLLYSLTQPSAQLVDKVWIWFFPAITIFISLVHTAWIKSELFNDETLSQLFAWTTVIVQLCLTLSLIRIIWIVS